MYINPMPVNKFFFDVRLLIVTQFPILHPYGKRRRQNCNVGPRLLSKLHTSVILIPIVCKPALVQRKSVFVPLSPSELRHAHKYSPLFHRLNYECSNHIIISSIYFQLYSIFKGITHEINIVCKTCGFLLPFLVVYLFLKYFGIRRQVCLRQF